MKTSLLLMLFLSNICLADYMGDSSIVKGVGKYKIGDNVLFSVKGSGYSKDECDGIGTIRNYVVHNKTYMIRGVTCTDGNNEVWYVEEKEIIKLIIDKE